MATRLDRWLRLPVGERWRLLAIMLALPGISAMVNVLGVVRTRHWLESASRVRIRRGAGVEDLRAAERLARLAQIAGRNGAIEATCLRQALLLNWWLRRRGLDPSLRLGVRKQDEVFDAHAWVELEGVPLGQSRVEHAAFVERSWTTPAIR